ncbi:tetratricopeptide repeat protein [Candidatus Contendibacter odensensis]|uniref:Probable UDP-N-acetylglucosamine--peptide N-acetylglucosaminyltransferase SPINDLY n=1 Tax=Candidatus Contendobacter odensis Run_B_J11 TaxID=1400861 RepID=A0A7U7G961_9GAMM|nr:tetratricopeptide repeat protein [Candidatus Contendobacter odensis]CDH44155.1 putative Tetratricopeptide TPR_2 repeat-containing protein [Candidatus Contendobacter odensis Run_B_J11]
MKATPNSPSASNSGGLLQEALRHHQAGRLREARKFYERLLVEQPHHADALHLLGVLYHQGGDHHRAQDLINQAIAHFPKQAVYHNNLGRVFEGLDDLDGAIRCYRQAVKLKPDFAEAHYNLANVLKNRECFEEACQHYRQAVQYKPNYPDAYYNLGNTLRFISKYEEAIVCYQQTLRLKPDHAKAYNNLGVTWLLSGQLDQAISAYQQAIILDPNYFEAHYNLGKAFEDQQRWDEAIACYERTLAVKPDHLSAHLQLGLILKEQKRLDEALACYQRAVLTNSDAPEIHNNLGNTLKDKDFPEQAVACYLKALTIRPDSAEVHNNLGAVFLELDNLDKAMEHLQQAIVLDEHCFDAHSNLGHVFFKRQRVAEAIVYYRKTLALKPEMANIHAHISACLTSLGVFDDFINYSQKILESDERSLVSDGNSEAWNNFLFTLNYHPDLSMTEIYDQYLKWERRYAKELQLNVAIHTNHHDPSKRLRIGYVSPDFRAHSTRSFIAPVLANHDHEKFEIFAYAELKQEDSWTTHYQSWVDEWRPTRRLSDVELAERVRADGIDILVDLAGHTTDNRLLVFARKPAPVQISWLGYGYTTGLQAMDYFLGDDRLTPPGCESWFSERIWRLPHAWSYRPAKDAPEVNPLPAEIQGYVTLGSLSRAIRFNERVIAAWSDLLKAIPTARLMLNSPFLGELETAEMVANRFIHHGITRDRLVVTHTPVWEGYHQLDIALDPFPHNAGTTTFEALWMGVPVVSLRDRPSMGRFGDAILDAMGLSEWVADSVEDYLAIVARLASDLDALSVWRATLRGRMLASPLCDESGFTRDLENAYRQMWQIYCQQ